MGYKIQSKIRIDLGDLGTDNQGSPFFVEIRNPKLMTFGDREQFKQFTSQDGDQALNGMAFLKKLIVSWNLTDVDSDQPIQLNDENALFRVPLEVITRIANASRPQQDEQTKNSSEQSAKS